MQHAGSEPDGPSVRSPEWRSGAHRAPLQKIKERRPRPGGRREHLGAAGGFCGGSRAGCNTVGFAGDTPASTGPATISFARACAPKTSTALFRNETPISRMSSSLVFRHSFVIRHWCFVIHRWFEVEDSVSDYATQASAGIPKRFPSSKTFSFIKSR
jgi:hypothetical protein